MLNSSGEIGKRFASFLGAALTSASSTHVAVAVVLGEICGLGLRWGGGDTDYRTSELTH